MIKKFFRKKAKDFDATFYLDLYPDIRIFGLKSKIFATWHWVNHGMDERRLSSIKVLDAGVRKKPSVGEGIFYPKALLNYKFIDQFKLENESKRVTGSLLVIVPELQPKLFFAGYRALFSDVETIQDLFQKVVVVVSNPSFDDSLLANLSNLTVVSKNNFERAPFEPDVIISFDAKTTLYAIENLGFGSKTIYYCQDFEAGFHPYGSLHIWSLRALALAQHAVISTKELYRDLRDRGALSTESVCVVSPKIETFSVEPIPEKVIFAYFRPEGYNSRNAAEHIWKAMEEFCTQETGWKFYLVGTQGTNFEFELNGNKVFVIEKLLDKDYKQVLASAHLCLAFIYSSHPGVLAYQTALSGIKTITNTFGARTEESLRSISSNLVPIDLVKENLAQAIRREIKNFGPRTPQADPRVDLGNLRDFVIGVNHHANL